MKAAVAAVAAAVAVVVAAAVVVMRRRREAEEPAGEAMAMTPQQDELPPGRIADYASRHFRWRELDPLARRTPEVETRLRYLAQKVLDPLRDAWGPLRVTQHGGYHPPDAPGWPQRGAGSRHRKGKAADLWAPGPDAQRLRATIRALVQSGAIPDVTAVAYPWGVHVDLDPGRTWNTGVPQ